MSFTVDTTNTIKLAIGWSVQSFFWVVLWYLSTRFSIWEKEYKAQSLRNTYKKLSSFLEFAVVGCIIPLFLFLIERNSPQKLSFLYPTLDVIGLFLISLMASCIFWLFEFKSQTTLVRARKLASIYLLPLSVVLLIIQFQLMPIEFGFLEISLLVTLPLTLNCILVYLMMRKELESVQKEKNVKLQLKLRGKTIRRDLLLFYSYFIFVIPAFYGYFNFSVFFIQWWFLGTFYTSFFLFLGKRSIIAVLTVFMTFFTYAFPNLYPWIQPILVIPILIVFADMFKKVEYNYTYLPTKNEHIIQHKQRLSKKKKDGK